MILPLYKIIISSLHPKAAMRLISVVIIICLYYFIYIYLFASCLYSQEFNFPFSKESENKFISFGFDKLVSTYSFNNQLYFSLNSSYGNFYINHNYRGNANLIPFSTHIEVPFRDDERFNFEYALPISSYINLLAATDWLLSADSKSIGINKLERLNNGLGLRLNFLNNSYLDLKAGYEKNNQIGVISNSPFINLRGLINNLDYDGYITNALIYGEYASLNYNRKNANLYINTKINKNYDADNFVNLDLNYKLQNLNDLAPMQTPGFNDYNVETRLENSFNSILDINFKISEFPVGLKFSFNEMFSDKQYQIYLAEKSITGIIRKRNLQQLAFLASSAYFQPDFSIRFGMSFDLNNDKFSIINSSNIPAVEELNLKNIESQRNFIESSTKLFTGIFWKLSSYDTINLNFSISLLRRDTPSELNYYDHDILNFLTDLSYSHKFSSLLVSNITIGAYNTHFVYIKSKKSADNNWVRIFRLSPKIIFITTKFRMQPQFEVLAVYTIYDFENLTPGTSANSKRQIDYRDSIQFNFSENFSLNSYLFFRYYEYGLLYWDSYSESPQSGNFEQFSKFMLNFLINDNFTCAVGARYYTLKEKYLYNIFGDPVKNENTSIGPELSIKIKFEKSTELSLDGWYEFQYVKGGSYREIPNVFLNAVVWL